MGTRTHVADAVEYPDSDGKPMAENTLQYEWIVTIKGNLDALFAGDPNVFVAGDNLIYAKQGDPKEVKAPDVYVAFGRPKGHRGSYKVWEEGGLFPQIVFEILSPGNSDREMDRKRKFYSRYGVEEYYVIDPDDKTLEIWRQEGARLVPQTFYTTFTSPRLGIRFERTMDELVLSKPNGERFLGFVELVQRADDERARGDRLAAKLRSLGIDPDAV